MKKEKRNYFKYGVLFVVLLFSFSSCSVMEQMSDIKRFSECTFGVSNVTLDELAGIDMQRIQSKNDMDMGMILTLGKSLTKGELPALLTVTVSAYNPGTKNAQIAGLDWEILMKNVLYGSGKIDQRIEVKPGQSATFPIKARFDLLKVISSESINDLIAFVLDSKDKEKLKKLDIKLKVRPWYMQQGEARPVPAYITIRP